MVEQLLARLDELGAKAVLTGAGAPETLRVLSKLEEEARNAGRDDAARSVEDLARAVISASDAEKDRLMKAGLENLRRLLESSGKAAAPSPIAQDPELIRDFVNEADEHLAEVEAQVLALERDPSSIDPLHAAFRSFHTIKGLAGFLDLQSIREVSHEVETLLDRARKRDLAVTSGLNDGVLERADYLKRAIRAVESSLQGAAGPDPPSVKILARVRAALAQREPTPVVAAERESRAPDQEAAAPDPSKDQEARSDKQAGSTLRVDASRLDYMMDMVGELVIAQSLVSHDPQLRSLENGSLHRRLNQLGRITGEVQRMAMGLRMMPVGHLFSRMRRLVRDLARKNGKQVRLETQGEETELDKTIIEAIADPLMHMVRNSLDHGVEPTQERLAKGKPAEGCVVLAASHQTGHIILRVSDDGRGLNTEGILKKARERALIAPNQSLSENEIFHLIFLPGFSTAEKITDVSGRGVGMDVVRRQIEGLRGRIDIESTLNQGTTFHLRLPLTLAIIDGLIVGVGQERYILPLSSVREMLRPTPQMLFTIEQKAEMAMIRGALLPVVRLNRRFEIPSAVDNPCEGLFVVAECEGRRFCLLVDQLLGKQEVVIKSMGEAFRNVAEISGGAILGDGRVGLILDLNGVFREAVHA